MLEFNPVQTNQMPRREKLIQRFWELIRPVFWGISPWFARRWRLGVLRYIAKMGGRIVWMRLPLAIVSALGRMCDC